jgi:hypothetical protein
MASLLLGCAAVCSDRMSKRRKAKRESKKDYDAHFEDLKAENLRRESWRQSQSSNHNTAMAQVPSGIYDNTVPGDAPPNYDDVAVRKSMEHSVDGRVGGSERAGRPLFDQTVIERSTNISPV